MIELIITIAMLSFGVVGVYLAFSPAVRASYTISSRITASYLVQEGFEIVRNLRDTNFARSSLYPGVRWSTGLEGCALGCRADYKTGTSRETFENQLKVYVPKDTLRLDQSGLYSYDAGVETPFERKITISQDSGRDSLKVTVQVMWNYNGRPFEVQTTGYLYNWR